MDVNAKRPLRAVAIASRLSHTAMIFGFYIFDRKGTCLWSRQWKRLSRTKETEGVSWRWALPQPVLFLAWVPTLLPVNGHLYLSCHGPLRSLTRRCFCQDITLMYGMLFSLKKFVSRINPRGGYGFCCACPLAAFHAMTLWTCDCGALFELPAAQGSFSCRASRVDGLFPSDRLCSNPSRLAPTSSIASSP